MIKDWLKPVKREKYLFELYYFRENYKPDASLLSYLQREIITAYRDIEMYKFTCNGIEESKIKQYIIDYVIPSDKNQITKNVRQGDWGEILTSLIATYFQDLEVPIHKLKWKFNKDRSTFSTDLFSHNKDGIIKDLYYYEIKTRFFPETKESEDGKSKYITIIAHNSLLKDSLSPTEAIADFLMRINHEKGNYDKAMKYKDIILEPDKFNRNYELFFIIEKSKFIINIIEELNNLPPKLSPLRITVVLIENLKQLIEDSWKDIEEKVIEMIK